VGGEVTKRLAALALLLGALALLALLAVAVVVNRGEREADDGR
jgi:hypothetical protein